MTASVTDLWRLPEVFALSDTGDELPAADTVVGAMPEPAGADSFYVRVPPPRMTGPRRVGLQAGHWLTADAPDPLRRLRGELGTSAGDMREVDLDLDVAKRVAVILERRDVVVDILPTTVPVGYVADAFVAIHADGEGSGSVRGYKLAHGARRTPYEDDLEASVAEHYAAATSLPRDEDPRRLSLRMTSYYAFSWERSAYATSPFTPSVIVEMGYLTNDADREVLADRADLVAAGLAEGILRFLAAHPRDMLIGRDLLVPVRPQYSITPQALRASGRRSSSPVSFAPGLVLARP